MCKREVGPEYAGEDFHNTKSGAHTFYPCEYHGPRPIAEQIEKLAELYDLSAAEAMRYAENVLPSLSLPEGAEGWFAVPKVDALVRRHFKGGCRAALSYRHALVFALERFSATRQSYYRLHLDKQLDIPILRRHERTEAMLAHLAESQQGEIMVVPAQFGLGHRYRSSRRVRLLVERTGDEFALGALEVLSMLAIHPERFSGLRYLKTTSSTLWYQQHIICAGDMMPLGARYRDLNGVTELSFDRLVRFDRTAVNHAPWHGGIASGFRPMDN